MMAVDAVEDMAEAVLNKDAAEAVPVETRVFLSTMSIVPMSIGHSPTTNSGQWGLKVVHMSIKRGDFNPIVIMGVASAVGTPMMVGVATLADTVDATGEEDDTLVKLTPEPTVVTTHMETAIMPIMMLQQA